MTVEKRKKHIILLSFILIFGLVIISHFTTSVIKNKEKDTNKEMQINNYDNLISYDSETALQNDKNNTTNNINEINHLLNSLSANDINYENEMKKLANATYFPSLPEETEKYRLIGNIDRISSSASSDDKNYTNFKNVKAYGAVGDGLTDDSDAILLALSEEKNIFFPNGIYKVSKQLVIPNNCQIQGEQETIIEFSNNETISYDYGYLVNENSSWKTLDILAHDIIIKDITLRKTNISPSEKALLLLSNIENVTIDNVTFETTQDDPVNTIDILVNCHDIQINNCTFNHRQNSQVGGLWIRDRNNNGTFSGTDNISIFGCTFNKYGGKDEIIAIFTTCNESKKYALVKNVSIEKCNFNIYQSSIDSSGSYNQPHTFTISQGDTQNINFENCNIVCENLLLSCFKFINRESYNVLSPVLINECNIICPTSYRDNGGYVFYTENSNGQLNAVVTNSSITASNNVVISSSYIDFDNCTFEYQGNAAILDGYNTATNCTFNCTNNGKYSRILRNNKCTIDNCKFSLRNIIDSDLYVLQPLSITNCSFSSDRKVLLQGMTSNLSYNFRNNTCNKELATQIK